MKKALTLLVMICGIAAGSDVLATGPSVSSGAASDVILAGDKLNIRVYREEEMTAVWHGTSVGYAVDALGNVTFPLIGTIRAEGLTLEAFQAKLTEALTEYLVNPQVSISFHEKNIAQEVAILGQITKSGKYKYTRGMTITQLISQSGGFAQASGAFHGVKYLADSTRVQVTRRGADGAEHPAVVDVAAILEGRQADFELQPGDLVVVPERDASMYVSILGQVNRPGNYEFASGMSLVRLVSEAQGFTRLAAQGQVVVTRESAGDKTVLRVDMDRVMMGRSPDVRLEPGDVVFVPESSF